MLIVQEDRANDSLSSFLKSEGFNVYQLDKADKIELQVEDKKPDLLLLPVELRKGNGIELCQQLKQKGKSSDHFIILISISTMKFIFLDNKIHFI